MTQPEVVIPEGATNHGVIHLAGVCFGFALATVTPESQWEYVLGRLRAALKDFNDHA